jgi:hypothetical protein
MRVTASPLIAAKGREDVHPLVPADAGTQTLPTPKSVRFGKGWIPASAGMSGCGDLSRFRGDDLWDRSNKQTRGA